jgi:hypothetical protein
MPWLCAIAQALMDAQASVLATRSFGITECSFYARLDSRADSRLPLN